MSRPITFSRTLNFSYQEPNNPAYTYSHLRKTPRTQHWAHGLRDLPQSSKRSTLASQVRFSKKAPTSSGSRIMARSPQSVKTLGLAPDTAVGLTDDAEVQVKIIRKTEDLKPTLTVPVPAQFRADSLGLSADTRTSELELGEVIDLKPKLSAEQQRMMDLLPNSSKVINFSKRLPQTNNLNRMLPYIALFHQIRSELAKKAPKLDIFEIDEDLIDHSDFRTEIEDLNLSLAEKRLLCFGMCCIYKMSVPAGQNRSFAAVYDQTPFGAYLLDNTDLDMSFASQGLYRLADALIEGKPSKEDFQTLVDLSRFAKTKASFTLDKIESAIQYLPFEVLLGFDGSGQCLTLDIGEDFGSYGAAGAVTPSPKTIATLQAASSARVTHNHPSRGPLSLSDVYHCKRLGLDEVRAVRRGRSPSTARPIGSLEDLQAAWQAQEAEHSYDPSDELLEKFSEPDGEGEWVDHGLPNMILSSLQEQGLILLNPSSPLSLAPASRRTTHLTSKEKVRSGKL
jgi:hypothetical protein